MVPSKFKDFCSNVFTQIQNYKIVGFGSGLIIEALITEIAKNQLNLQAIASSDAISLLLKKFKIPEITLNDIIKIPLYIGEAEAYNSYNQFVHSNYGAFTREKIIAYNSEKIMITVSDPSTTYKNDYIFNHTNIAVEVLSIARSAVAREIIKLQGRPTYRNGFITDNNHLILDIENLNMNNPIHLEETLNNIPGVINNSLFAKKQASSLIIINC